MHKEERCVRIGKELLLDLTKAHVACHCHAEQQNSNQPAEPERYLQVAAIKLEKHAAVRIVIAACRANTEQVMPKQGGHGDGQNPAQKKRYANDCK